jgi:hypothetical protein
MHSNNAQTLLGHLYKIVPERKSATEISREIFNSNPINEILNELLREGFIYQWKNDAADKMPFPQKDQYGITVQGILFFGKFLVNKKTDLPVEAIAAPAIERKAVSVATNNGEEKEENISFRRVLPAIILILFAITLVWFIIHFKK